MIPCHICHVTDMTWYHNPRIPASWIACVIQQRLKHPHPSSTEKKYWSNYWQWYSYFKWKGHAQMFCIDWWLSLNPSGLTETGYSYSCSRIIEATLTDMGYINGFDRQWVAKSHQTHPKQRPDHVNIYGIYSIIVNYAVLSLNWTWLYASKIITLVEPPWDLSLLPKW